MSITAITSYRVSCDWPGCIDRLVFEGAKRTDAKARARREGWTFTQRKSNPRYAGRESTLVRCGLHAYQVVDGYPTRPDYRLDRAG